MRDGEIVRDRSGVIFRRLADGNRPEFRIEIVTVGQLFAAAGHYVPEGARLRHVDHCWTIVIDGSVVGMFKHGGWFRFDEYKDSNRIGQCVDLSRLPALDAWDALPEIVKAVVK